MQVYPYAGAPMSAGGQPVPGVAHVAAPPVPSYPTTSINQQPRAPYYRHPAQVAFPPPAIPGTQVPFTPPTPTTAHVPGPAALGAQPPLGTPSAVSGIAGVSMAPVANVQPAAASGGPHPLPTLPELPLPQGFPNPFAILELQMNPTGAPAGPPQHATPGTTTVTGPQGYLPGLGYFGTPTAPAPGPHPFWLQVGWYLLQRPEVKEAIESWLPSALQEPNLQRTLHAAGLCLSDPKMQQALESLSSGTIDQNRFIELFSDHLKNLLQFTGILPR